MDRLQRVNNSLSSQIGRLQNIRNTIEETGNLAEQARARVESTEQLIEIASRELEKAKVAVANVVSGGDTEVGAGRRRSATVGGGLAPLAKSTPNMEQETVTRSRVKTTGHLGPFSSFALSVALGSFSFSHPFLRTEAINYSQGCRY